MSNWIVAVFLGDSLTAGFQQGLGYMPPKYYPFVNMLESSLRNKITELDSDLDFALVNQGMNGDSTMGMLERFSRSVESERPDIVLIWGGINDLSALKKPTEVFPNIVELVNQTKAINAVPIVVNASPVAGTHFNDNVRELNQLTEDYCMEQCVEYVDVFSLLVDPMGKLTDEFSNDGVHLSDRGYQKIMQSLFQSIMKIIEALISAP